MHALAKLFVYPTESVPPINHEDYKGNAGIHITSWANCCGAEILSNYTCRVPGGTTFGSQGQRIPVKPLKWRDVQETKLHKQLANKLYDAFNYSYSIGSGMHWSAITLVEAKSAGFRRFIVYLKDIDDRFEVKKVGSPWKNHNSGQNLQQWYIAPVGDNNRHRNQAGKSPMVASQNHWLIKEGLGADNN